jgi:hypothetical protein
VRRRLPQRAARRRLRAERRLSGRTLEVDVDVVVEVEVDVVVVVVVHGAVDDHDNVGVDDRVNDQSTRAVDGDGVGKSRSRTSERL